MDQQPPQWRTSSYTGNSGNCVEVAIKVGHAIAVRDTNDPDGPELTFSQQRWDAFTRRAKRGATDLRQPGH